MKNHSARDKYSLTSTPVYAIAMKRVALFVLIIATCVACRLPADDPTVDPSESTKVIEVMGAGGEFATTQTKPAGLLGVQVYSHDSKGVKQAYAYGIFDDWNLGALEVKDGYSYSFEATFVVDGTTEIYSTGSTIKRYSMPFATSTSEENSTPEQLTGAFIVAEKHLNNIMGGKVRQTIYGNYKTDYTHALVQRYCAVTSEIAYASLANVSLNLKMVYTTLKFSSAGLSKGALFLLIDGAPPVAMDLNSAAGATVEKEFKVAHTGTTPASSAWLADTYSESAAYKLYYDETAAVDANTDVSAITMDVNNLIKEGTLTLERGKILPLSVVRQSSDQSNLEFDFEGDATELSEEVVVSF